MNKKVIKFITFFLFVVFYSILFSQETETSIEQYEKKIFFVIEDSKNFFQIGVMDIDGNNKKILTKNGNNWCPTISPKGDKIAFYSDRNNYTNLWVMNTDGTEQTQLTKNYEDIHIIDLNNRGQISWNLDSEEIYFLKNRNICKIDKTGNSFTNITLTKDITSFKLSPDGKKWLFSREKTKNYNGLWTMNYNTTGLMQIVESNISNPVFDWSVNNQILYLHNRGISLINYDGTNYKLVLNIINLNNDITWAKFNLKNPDKNFFAYINNDNNIYVMSIDGKFQKQITKNGGYSPYWLDTETLLYIENYDIYKSNINTLKKQRLTFYLKAFYPVSAEILKKNNIKIKDVNSNNE